MYALCCHMKHITFIAWTIDLLFWYMYMYLLKKQQQVMYFQTPIKSQNIVHNITYSCLLLFIDYLCHPTHITNITNPVQTVYHSLPCYIMPLRTKSLASLWSLCAISVWCFQKLKLPLCQGVPHLHQTKITFNRGLTLPTACKGD